MNIAIELNPIECELKERLLQAIDISVANGLTLIAAHLQQTLDALSGPKHAV